MAHWIIKKGDDGGYDYKCSICGGTWDYFHYEHLIRIPSRDTVERCPHCNQPMNGEPEYLDANMAVIYNMFKHENGNREKIVKKFVAYLKEHSCNYDFSRDLSNCSYHSFRGIDTDDLDDMAEEFLKTI